MDNLDQYLNQIICGNALTLLKELPDESVDCCITSPPYYGLRDYGHHGTIWDGDPNCEHDFSLETKSGDIRYRKGHNTTVGNQSNPEVWQGDGKGNLCTKCGAWKGQLGLEPTYKLYIQHLLAIFKEVKRVLKKTGTCWVNIADSYSGSNCGKGDYREDKSLQKDIYNKPSPQSLSSRFSKWRRDGEGGTEGNCITRINTAIPNKSLIGIPERFALAMTDELGFIRRNTIIWHKPNCMPASVSDRFTSDFEFLYFFTVSPKYYFEQQFEPLKDVSITRLDRGVSENNKWINGADGQSAHNLSKPRLNIKHRKMEGTKYGGDGKGLHDHSGYYSADGTPRFYPEGRNKRCVWAISTKSFSDAHFATFPQELIETPIKAGCPEGGIVLDCFAGSGTTALVALKLNRSFIGFEISQKYVDIANKRLKPYRTQGRIEFATPVSVG